VIDETLEAAVRRYWREVWSLGQVEHLHEFYAPRFRENDEELTPAEFAGHVLRWREKFPDFTAEVDRVFGWPGGIATRVVYRGTHLGDFAAPDVPATGRRVEASGLDVFEFADGRVVQHWHEADHYVLFDQLGAVPVLQEGRG
jgi:predicted ester cyclase